MDDIILLSAATGIPSNILKQSLELTGFVAGEFPKGFDLDHGLETVSAWCDI